MPEEALESLREYLKNLIKSVDLFRKSLKLLNEVRVGEARSLLAEVVKARSEANKSRLRLIEVIENSRLEPSVKEDILHFIKRLDAISDNVKEAARELTIMPYLEVPSPIRDGLNRLADLVLQAASHVAEATERLIAGEHKRALELVNKVLEIEEEADKVDVDNRGKLIVYADVIKPSTLAILIHDFNRDLENAVDACAEAADYLHILITTWLQIEMIV
jgi:predicted phosphate transport protein (TIGR00153 family)